jgi:hypothetical protein
MTAEEVELEGRLLDALDRLREGAPQRIAIAVVSDDDKRVLTSWRGSRLEASGLFLWAATEVIRYSTGT